MDRPGTLIDRATATPDGTATGGSIGRPTPATIVGLGVGIAAVAAALLRVGVNAPVSLPRAVVAASPAVDGAVLVVGGMGALVLGLLDASPVGRIGLVASGVFGLLAAIAPAAAVPATGVAVVGALIVGVHRRHLGSILEGRTLVGLGYVLAMGAALGAATGVLGPGFRAVGAWAALLALATLSTVYRPGRIGWIAAGVAVAIVLVGGIVAPFLTGAIVLIVAGVIGAPLALVAAGVGGGVAAVAGAVSAERYRPALGAVILIATGVPATLPRAVAAVVGLALVLDRAAVEVSP